LFDAAPGAGGFSVDWRKVSSDWGQVPVTVKAATLGIAALVVGGVVGARACGAVDLPAKPPAPVATTRDVTKALATTAATSSAWTMFAKQDAAAAGLVFDAPSMSRAFPYQQDRARHVLSAGQSVTLAGLTLTAGTAAAGGQKVLTLTIANPRDTAVAYRVATTTSTGVGGCTQRVGLPHNAIVVSARSEVQRAECTWATDLQLVITAVDALEVPPLAAHYLSQISPSALALDERPAMGHQRASGGCEILAWPALTAAVAQGTITFRDLADFYGRHRCESYKFSMDYKYFERDNERPLPAVAPT
jgi:hypothetical protein